MASNCYTYHANKQSREAWINLEIARNLKARVAAGTAYEWEVPRIEMYAKLARSAMHLSLKYRGLSKEIMSKATNVSPTVLALLRQINEGGTLFRGTDYPLAFWFDGMPQGKVRRDTVERAIDTGLLTVVPYRERRFVSAKIELTEIGRTALKRAQ